MCNVQKFSRAARFARRGPLRGRRFAPRSQQLHQAMLLQQEEAGEVGPESAGGAAAPPSEPHLPPQKTRLKKLLPSLKI